MDSCVFGMSYYWHWRTPPLTLQKSGISGWHSVYHILMDTACQTRGTLNPVARGRVILAPLPVHRVLRISGQLRSNIIFCEKTVGLALDPLLSRGWDWRRFWNNICEGILTSMEEGWTCCCCCCCCSGDETMEARLSAK